MIKKHFLTIVIFCLIGITFWFILKNAINKNGNLVGPTFIQQIIHQQLTPTPEPAAISNAPKTFNFDSSTNLKQELEKVNPQVLDSDFE